jgi:hypothetical protein
MDEGRRFVAAAPQRPLGVDLPFPVRAAPGGERLHLVGGWSSSRPAIHLALDGDGAGVVGPTPLPLGGAASVAGLDGGVVIGGSSLDGGGPAVLELDAGGAVDEVPRVLWATGPPEAALWCARLDQQLAEPVCVLEPSQPVIELALAPMGGRVLAACLHGSPATLDLVMVDGEEPRPRARLEASAAFSLALGSTRAGGVLAWAGRADRAIHSVQLDARLQVGKVTRGAVAAPGARLRSVRVAGDGQGRLGVLFQAAVTRPGPIGQGQKVGPRSHPGRLKVWHHLAGAEALSTARPQSLELRPPGVVYEAAGWLGGRLLVVHGDTEAVVSAFQLSA